MNQILNKLKTMKNLSYLLIFFLAIGCADLDLSPTDMIAEDAVKKDPSKFITEGDESITNNNV